ncbi:MAG: hypothetical protein ABWJ98_03130 [Hydrogenothermaceae bacterium]
MIKKKLFLLGISLVTYSFSMVLGLTVINFMFKNDIFTDKPDFYKAVWIVITTTLFSGSVIFILRLKVKSDITHITEEVKQEINKLYSEKDFIWNRRITMAYGITFLFLFFAIIMSELLSFFFEEGLLSPVQLAFHTTAFIGYVATLRYIWKSQDYLEYISRQMVKKQLKQEEELERF